MGKMKLEKDEAFTNCRERYGEIKQDKSVAMHKDAVALMNIGYGYKLVKGFNIMNYNDDE